MGPAENQHRIVLRKPKRDFLVTPFQRRLLIERYEASNRWITENYLWINEGRLFPDPMPDVTEGENAYPRLSAAHALEIMIHLHDTNGQPEGSKNVRALFHRAVNSQEKQISISYAALHVWKIFC